MIKIQQEPVKNTKKQGVGLLKWDVMECKIFPSRISICNWIQMKMRREKVSHGQKPPAPLTCINQGCNENLSHLCFSQANQPVAMCIRPSERTLPCKTHGESR